MKMRLKILSSPAEGERVKDPFVKIDEQSVPSTIGECGYDQGSMLQDGLL